MIRPFPIPLGVSVAGLTGSGAAQTIVSAGANTVGVVLLAATAHNSATAAAGDVSFLAWVDGATIAYALFTYGANGQAVLPLPLLIPPGCEVRFFGTTAQCFLQLAYKVLP